MDFIEKTLGKTKSSTKIIGACGMWRSGSTAQYNMIRLVVEHSEIDAKVIKWHVADKRLWDRADFVFTSERHIGEVMESLERFGRLSGRKRNPNYIMKQIRYWKSHPRNTHQDFERIKTDSKGCIKQIAEVLGVQIDLDKVYEEFKAIKPPKDKWCPVTLMFPNHITKED